MTFSVQELPKHAQDGPINGILILGAEVTARVTSEQRLEEESLRIGLFISKEIVEAHKGLIWVESELELTH